MLKTQIHRFLSAGITQAELRLGYGGATGIRELKSVTREIDAWIEERGDAADVGDGEIWVRPCLPPCWDSSA